MTHDTPPKRIWVIPDASGVKHEWHSGWYQGRPNGRHRVEYTLASEADAMVAAALREAAERQITGAELESWLRENGGVNTLFLGRGTLAASIERKTLYLNQTIKVPKTGRFTVTLEMDHRGFFNVVLD